MTLIALLILLLLRPSSGSDLISFENENTSAILTYSIPGSLEVNHNETGQMTIKINNEGSIPLHNILIDIVGVPKVSYSFNPAMLDVLELGSSTDFSLSINPKYIPPGIYTINVRFISDETSETSSFTLNIKSVPSDVEDNDYIENNKSIISSIVFLLIIVIIVSVSILIIMFVLFKAKRCPLCGANLIKDYEGENYTSFKCSKCKYYNYTIKKKT